MGCSRRGLGRLGAVCLALAFWGWLWAWTGESWGLDLSVQPQREDSFSVSADPEDTIADVKQVIEDQQGYAASLQRLLFEARQVADDRTLAEAGIGEGAELALVLRRGTARTGCHGQVTDAETDYGLDGATVRFDRLPADGEAEYEFRTDLFGFYESGEMEAGDYRVEASQPGYKDGLLVPVTVVGGAASNASFALEPVGDGNFFDIYVQVACVKTGMLLADVPVQVTVQPIVEDGLPTPETLQQLNLSPAATTDANGFAEFANLPAGTFTFSINEGAAARPGWGSVYSQGEAPLNGHSLDKPHMANVLLKPAERELLVTVKGYDPVTEQENVPLEGVYVELTGVHPEDHGRELVPTRTGASGVRKEADQYWDNTMAGKVRFRHMPPIDWRVDGKRLGYKKSTVHVTAQADGTLSDEELTVTMQLQPTRLTVVLESCYEDTGILLDLPVTLKGLANSNTAGIAREAVAAEDEEGRAVAVFERILPGKYQIEADGVGQMSVDITAGETREVIKTKTFSARLRGFDYAEAYNGINHDAVLRLEPERITLRGKLYAAEEHQPLVESNCAEPAYHARSDQPGIRIVASEYLDGHIPEEERTRTLRSDDNGEFCARLLPGLYGVKIDGMDEYWGSKVRCYPQGLSREARRAGEDPAEESGWPYFQRWTYGKDLAETWKYWYEIGGLPVNAETEPYVELFADLDEFHLYCMFEPRSFPAKDWILGADGRPPWNRYQDISLHYFNELVRANGTAGLDGPNGLKRTQALRIPFDGGDKGIAYFTNLPPGDYSVTMDHPRFTLDREEADFSAYDYNPPGHYPETPPPNDWDTPKPMRDYWPHLPCDFNDAGGTFELTFYEWVPPDGETVLIGYYAEHARSTSKYDIIRTFDFAQGFYFYNSSFWPASGSCHAYLVTEPLHGEEGAPWDWYDLGEGSGNWDVGINLDGPEKTPVMPQGLDFAYNLSVTARNNVNPNETIEGVSVELPNGQKGTTPVEFSGTTSSLRLGYNSVSHENWVYSSKQIRPDTSGATPTVELILHMEQGIAVSGTVLNAVTDEPVPGAQVNLQRVTGEPENCDYARNFAVATAADGSFDYGQAAYKQDYFLEVIAKGFQVWRRKLPVGTAVANPEDPRALAHVFDGDKAIKLQPLARPEVVNELAVDCKGAFLPAIKGNFFTGGDVRKTLTMNWSFTVRHPVHEYTLPAYETGEERAQGDTEDIAIEDPVLDVRLVDLRSFAENSYDDDPDAIAPPNDQDPIATHEWLRSVFGDPPGHPNVYKVQVTSISSPDAEGRQTVSGQIPLWELPPGTFAPAFAVITEMGAVRIYRPPLEDTLEGIRMPPWFAFLSDVVGTAKAVDAKVGDMTEFLPDGRIEALPDVTAEVEKTDANYLNYTYGIEVSLLEGQEGPMSGILGMAPGFLGLNVNAGAEMGIEGESRKFSLNIAGAVEKETTVRKSFLPSYARDAVGVDVGFDPMPNGEVSSTFAHILSGEYPNNLMVDLEVGGTVGLRCVVDLTNSVNAIPLIGPVIVKINRVARKFKSGLKLEAGVGGLVGLESKTFWSTGFPRLEVDNSTIAPPPGVDHVRRRHFLGGIEERQKGTTFDLGFNFGVDLSASLGERAGGSGALQLTGEPSELPGEPPVLLVESNPVGDWPPIKRIRGDARAVFTAFVDVYVYEKEKEWVFKLIKLDKQFGTEPVFQLIEMDVNTIVRALEDFEQVDFLGLQPQLARDFISIGSYAAAGTGNALVFTDMAQAGDDAMCLLLTERGGDGWGERINVTGERNAIIAAELADLPGGGRMVVWVEVPEEDVGSAYPRTEVWYALSEGGGTWSAPGLVGNPSRTVAGISLVADSAGLTLFMNVTDSSPASSDFGLLVATFDAGSWTPARDVLQAQQMRDWTVVPADGAFPALFLYVDDAGAVWAVDADRQPERGLFERVHVGPQELVDAALAPGLAQFAVCADASRIHLLAHSAGGWEDRGVVLADVAPSELAVCNLQGTADNTLAVAWTQGGAVKSLFFAFVDPVTGDASEIHELTGNTKGAYKDLVLLPRNDREAVLTARYQNDQWHELRRFVLSTETGVAEADADGDAMRDTGELLVVDDDPQDSFALIDDVLPEQDYDEDDYSNSVEIAAGTHPADADSRPGTAQHSFDCTVHQGWNLISIPLHPDDPRPEAVFGDAVDPLAVYGWRADTYEWSRALECKQGYWTWGTASGTGTARQANEISMEGQAVQDPERELDAGWNLVGPVATEPYPDLDLPLQSTPADVITGPVWTWVGDRYEQADRLQCGRAYWIFAAEPCTIRLEPDSLQ